MLICKFCLNTDHTMWTSHCSFVLVVVILCLTTIRGNDVDEEHHVERRQACPDSNMCRSKWGFCGVGNDYCGEGCSAGPCSNGNGGSGNGGNTGGDGNIINDQTFACAFNTIDAGTRASRLTGLRNSGWKPANKDEAAVFLAHVFHETDGLKVIREYCAPGEAISSSIALSSEPHCFQVVVLIMLDHGVAFKVDRANFTTVEDGFNSLGRVITTLLDKRSALISSRIPIWSNNNKI